MNLLSYVHLRNIHGSTGAGRVARQLTEHLARQSGMNLHVLADAADHRTFVPKVGLPWTGFPYHLFSSDTSRQQARWLLTHRPIATSFWPEAEIIHCTAESYVPKGRRRLVVTVHDAAYFEPGVHAATWANWSQRCKWQLLYATLSRTADLFHTVSNFSAERLGAYFPAIRSRLRVVPNAVSPHFFEPVTAAGEAYLERSGLRGIPYILLPGGLHFRKNADLVIRAWPLLKQKCADLTLVIAGHSDPHFVPQIERFGGSVLRTGFVNDEELCALYARALAAWVPSRYEGFGLPVIEAMACGTPVVASDSASLPEVAGGAAILVPPDSPAEHADALHSLISNSALRAELQARGKDHASRFTWNVSAARFRDHLQALL
jgi:glycosyltransferase involved in cell wall biosynthesis